MTALNSKNMDIYGKQRKRSLPGSSTSNSKTMNQDTPPAKKAKVNGEGQAVKRLIVKMGPDVMVSREVSVKADRKRKAMGEGTSASRNMPLIEVESKRMRTTAPWFYESNLQNETSGPTSIADTVKTRTRRSSSTKDQSAEAEITLPKQKRKRKKKSAKNKLKDQIDKRPQSTESAGLKNKKFDDCIQNNQSKLSVKEEKDNNCIDLKPLVVPVNMSCSYVHKSLNRAVSSAEDLDLTTHSTESAGLKNKKFDDCIQNNQSKLSVKEEKDNNCIDLKPLVVPVNMSCSYVHKSLNRAVSSAEDLDLTTESLVDSINFRSKEDYHNLESVNLNFEFENNPNESKFGRGVSSASNSKPPVEFDYQREIQSIATTLKNSELELQTIGGVSSSYPNHHRLCENTSDYLSLVNKVVKSLMEKEGYIEPAAHQEYCPKVSSLIPATTDSNLNELTSQCTKTILEDTNKISKPDRAGVSPMTDSTAEKDPTKSDLNVFSEVTVKTAEMQFKESKELDSNSSFASSENLKYPIKVNESPKVWDPFKVLTDNFYGYEEIVESDNSLNSPESETWSAKEIVESDGGLVSPKPEMPSAHENTLLKVKSRSAEEIVESDSDLVSPKPEKTSISENTLLKEKTRSEKIASVLHIKNMPIVKGPSKFLSQTISNTLMPSSISTAPTAKKMPVFNQNSVATRTINSKDIPAASNASKEGEPKSQSENSRKILLNYKKTPLVHKNKVLPTPLNEKHLNGTSLPIFTEQYRTLNLLRISKTKHLSSPLLKESAQSMCDQENSKKETSGFSLPGIKEKFLCQKHVNGTISPSCSNHSRPLLTMLEVANYNGLTNSKVFSLPNRNANVVRVQNVIKSNGSKLSSFIPNGNIPGFSTHLNTEIRRIPKRGFVIPKNRKESQNPGKVAIPGSRLQSPLSKQGPLKLSSVEPRNNNRHENILRAPDPIKHNLPSMDHKHKNSASSKDDQESDRVKVVYAGNLPSGYDENCLRRRFEVFGKIKGIEIKKSKDKEYDSTNMDLHTFGEKKRFAFISFETREAATQARDNGNKCSEPVLKLDYGLRREYLRENYTDLDGKVAENERNLYNSHAPSITHLRKEDDDYSLLLAKEQMKRGLL